MRTARRYSTFGATARDALLAAFFSPMLATSAGAAMPANCSKAPVPAGPANGEIAHRAFAPTVATLRISQTESLDADKYEDYMLKLSKPEGDLDEAEADVTMMVHAGKRLDGRTFRKVPGGIDAQPMAAPGMPEIQGWSISDDATGVRLDSVLSEKSSLQVTLAQRKGNTIGGTIYLCEPSQDSGWIGGSFTANFTQ
jgi:hypothetical protein